MKVLIVGAGAVGQVYGYQLQKAGHHVTFYGRNLDSGLKQKGFILYPLNQSRGNPVEFKNFAVAQRIEDLGRSQFDLIFLCFPSTGLYDAEFAKLAATFGDALVVVLQPGLKDQEYAKKLISSSSFVSGVITFIAFQTPLPGSKEHTIPGVAYWFPPGCKLVFSGQKMLAERVIKLFERSEVQGKWVENTIADGAIPAAILSCFVKAVENENWSIDQFLASPNLIQVQTAMQEAIAIICRHYRIKLPLMRHFLTPWMFRMIIAFARWAMPFDLDVYLKFHYTKVAAQSQLDYESYLTLGAQYHLETTALKALLKL